MIIRFEKGRKLLRKVRRGVWAAAAALLFQACFATPDYGMPVPEYGMPGDRMWDVRIHGQVISDTTKAPIPGINVSIQGIDYHYDRTDKDGFFSIWVPRQDRYTLEFVDVDGPLNGGFFQTKEKELCLTAAGTSLRIYLKEHEEGP